MIKFFALIFSFSVISGLSSAKAQTTPQDFCHAYGAAKSALSHGQVAWALDVDAGSQLELSDGAHLHIARPFGQGGPQSGHGWQIRLHDGAASGHQPITIEEISDSSGSRELVWFLKSAGLSPDWNEVISTGKRLDRFGHNEWVTRRAYLNGSSSRLVDRYLGVGFGAAATSVLMLPNGTILVGGSVKAAESTDSNQSRWAIRSSTDHGATWQNLELRTRAQFYSSRIERLGLGHDGRIFMQAEISPTESGTCTAYFQSLDNANTWTPVSLSR